MSKVLSEYSLVKAFINYQYLKLSFRNSDKLENT